ncbi:O-antigen ligase family protein [Fictibacillus sp. CENA-BCM004]|uniref:O-antigen ligase family protein n=2 Tax=Fictibacillus terranigra TaxID=3058424 RepID=A0ABT8E222_9BACL|nr:O-antigen ligase family protein [Fictibacillus sp. CENA-BCM004]MDN4071938.1 O-antigen ligase family protein [Fictibacillus sp. CENA-BCM004]
MFFGFTSLIALFVFVILALIGLVKKNGKAKKNFLIAGVCMVVFIAAVSLDSANDTTQTASTNNKAVKKDTEEEKAKIAEAKAKDEAKQKAAAEQKAKEEAKAKAEAEQKAKAEAEAKKKAEAAAKAKAAAIAKRKADAMKISGNGDTATKTIKLDPGFVVFEARYTGSQNFIVSLLDENGSQVDLLVNTIGSYHGKRFVAIPDGGNYMFNVKASGSWTIQGSQDIPKEEKGTISGNGDDVRFVRMNSGARTFTLSHSGSENFIVKINDSVLLANEIGNYHGSTVESIPDDSVYAIGIQANGPWKISIK